MAFYCGWPKAWSTFSLIKEVDEDDDTKEEHGGIFGQGEPNINFAKYFVGNSYLKPLAKTDNNMKSAMAQVSKSFEKEINKSVKNLSKSMLKAISIDETAFLNAFKMKMNEEELLSAIMSKEKNTYENNLKKLNYAKKEKPLKKILY